MLEKDNSITEIKYKGRKCLQFNIRVTMTIRWIPHFLGMLAKIEELGAMGCSRIVKLYVDGDGDLQAKFEWSDRLEDAAEPIIIEGEANEEYEFDAG